MVKCEALPALPEEYSVHDVAGLIPTFVDANDPRPAREQLDDGYNEAAGCGWHPIENFSLLPGNVLQYPGDEPMQPLVKMTLHDETIYVYEAAFVAIGGAGSTFGRHMGRGVG